MIRYPEPARPRPATRITGTKTTFALHSSAGPVRCAAQNGALTIKVARDFTGLDRAKLERAIAGFIDGL